MREGGDAVPRASVVRCRLVRTKRLIPLAAAVALAAGGLISMPSGGSAETEFRYAIDNSPLDVTPKPGESLTDAVQEFRQTGKNPYSGREPAIADGRKLYMTYCQACHLPDGSGRMGASLIGEKHVHERITNDVGLFEVIFGGAMGAMQPFSKRMTQDEILKVMAFLRTLMKS
jgi:cytochrome c-L